MRNAITPMPISPSMPEVRLALEEMDALSPLVTFVDEPDSERQVIDGNLDEEVLDEAIFAGMVALR